MDLHIKCQLLSQFDELQVSRHIFEKKKYSNIKFHENPSSGRWTVSCGRTDRQTDMTKPIVAFRYIFFCLRTRPKKNNTEEQSPTKTRFFSAPQTGTIRSGSENHFITRCTVLNYIREWNCQIVSQSQQAGLHLTAHSRTYFRWWNELEQGWGRHTYKLCFGTVPQFQAGTQIHL